MKKAELNKTEKKSSQGGGQTRQKIEQYKNEAQKLQEQLACDNLHSTNIQTGSQIANLQDSGDTYARKIEIEKKKLEELERQISQVQEQIKKQRAEFHGSSGAKETNEQVAKKIKSLENKLDKALQKYNEAVAHNKQLREQINTLRRERVVYDNIYKKLEQELAQKRQEMQDIVAKGKEAYENMQKVKENIKKLKSEAEKEQSEFEKEWNELGRLIEQDKRMKDFIRQRDPTSNNEQPPSDLLSEEQLLKKKVARSAWGIAKDKASIHVSMEKVQTYEEAFAKIQAATGISDIDELVKTFVEAEKHNFSLFNYVNELSNEMEKLEQQISDIKSEIDKYKGQGLSTDNQRKKIMQELEERLQKTEVKAQQYENKYEQTMKIINALKVGIQSIFDRIGCNTEAVQEMLGFSGVTEANMMQYLGIIEQRTNEILQMYSACQAQSIDTSALFPLQNQGVQQTQQEKVKMEAPSIVEEEEDSEEETSLPFSKEDFKTRAIKNMSKKPERQHQKQQGTKKQK